MKMITVFAYACNETKNRPLYLVEQYSGDNNEEIK